MRAVRTRLTSLLNRRASATEPADGWFTLQTEPGEGEHTVAVAKLRDEAISRSEDRER
jgi:hypothetical protein